MSRARKIAIGTCALLLASTALLPRGDGPDEAIAPSADPAGPSSGAQVGRTQLTPAMRAEIERVVARGRTEGRVSPRATTATLARGLVRCADLADQRYCLHTGWTSLSETQAGARVADALAAEAAEPQARESTGDLSTLELLRRTAALTPEQRARAERRELVEAARSVDKARLLEQELSARASTSEVKRRADYPQRSVVLPNKNVRAQVRTYWCGPATMQMIARGWQGEFKSQRHWSRRLNTTTSGSSIWDMVRVVNKATGYDGPNRAGPYIVLDIGDYSFSKWLLLTMRHIEDYRAPLVLHPILLKRYYPYLDDDASGHFQVGRGYDKRGDKPANIGYFEPWNQQRFDPSEPYIRRVQWRSAYKSVRANKAHPQQNIGV